MPCSWAKAASRSAAEKSKRYGAGSVCANFIAFSGTARLKFCANAWAYAASESRAGLTAAPIKKPSRSAKSRRSGRPSCAMSAAANRPKHAKRVLRITREAPRITRRYRLAFCAYDSIVAAHQGSQLRHDLVQRIGLRRQLLGGGGAFFRIRRGALCHLIHLHNGARDLLHAAGLLLAALVHFVDQRFHRRGAFRDRSNGIVDLLQLDAAFACLRDRFADQSRGIVGGLRGAVRQIPDLVGNDGESHTGLSRAGSLDRGIQSENIRLKRDLFDDLDDLGNFI